MRWRGLIVYSMIWPVSHRELLSLSNVQEPRNAEFTVLLGSFFVQWQSNDNNFGNYSLYKYYINLSDKDVIDLFIFFNAESSSLISGSGVNMLPIKSISME